MPFYANLKLLFKKQDENRESWKILLNSIKYNMCNGIITCILHTKYFYVCYKYYYATYAQIYKMFTSPHLRNHNPTQTFTKIISLP